jgi:hypothetical protein
MNCFVKNNNHLVFNGCNGVHRVDKISRKNANEKKKNKKNHKVDQKKNTVPGLRLHEIADKIDFLLATDGLIEPAVQENLNGHLESTLHVAVIFCKNLDKNQITVEFSRRISAILNQIKSGKIKLDTIVFLGGEIDQNEFSSASAGYIYLRYLADKSKINLSGLDFIIEHTYSNFQDNLSILTSLLENKYGKEGVSRCHFTLISSDYHLIRISEIHRLSTRQSLLNPILKIGATWTYLFAVYPFCVSPDPNLAFLGRIRVLANELSVVLVNLNGHLEYSEMLSRENFTRLCETNRKLRLALRKMFEQDNLINLPKNSLNINLDYWETLEQSLGEIHDVQNILSPLITGKTVERIDLIKARDIFMNALKNIKLTVDPDRPLNQKEWLCFTEF